ncbi:MAG: acyl carrier protein [Lachnospiraceae bacterium]|nr:acyl carrier protein [Lachnospiraceae bacterium]
MTREEVFERLQPVFREVFDDDSITVTETTTSADIEDWDSLEHINLVNAIEAEFHMKFTMGQVVSMKDVGEMVTILLESGS